MAGSKKLEMEAFAPRRGRGRPPKPDAEKSGPTLSFRVKPKLRAALVEAAERNQRSLSEEAEHRLELSVHDDSIDAALFGDPGIKAICFMVAAALQGAKARTGSELQDLGNDKLIALAGAQTLALLDGYRRALIADPEKALAAALPLFKGEASADETAKAMLATLQRADDQASFDRINDRNSTSPPDDKA